MPSARVARFAFLIRFVIDFCGPPCPERLTFSILFIQLNNWGLRSLAQEPSGGNLTVLGNETKISYHLHLNCCQGLVSGGDLATHSHCYGDYSTTCKQCSKGTFMNEPNGLHKCFQCKNCDSGLSILHDCTIIRDTVCDVGDGYYCINYLNITRECSFAVKHTHCKPEQRIKTPGTKVSDTVCEPCPPGFYSHDGVNCSELTEVQYNTRTWNMRYGLIPCILLLAIICFYLKHPSAFERCITVKKPVEETSPHISEFAPSSSQLEKNEESEALQPDEDEDEDVTK